MSACIVGWGHTKFGKLEGEDVESLTITAAKSAIADAGIAPADIDAIYLGWLNSGFSVQDFGSSLVMNGIEELRFKPATRVENACATGSAAIYQGANLIDAGHARCVLAIGVEKMTDTPPAEIGPILMHCSYVREEVKQGCGFVDIFGDLATAYFEKYGDQSEALAAIAAKNHRNGCDNPLAHLRKDLGFDFCNTISDKNPLVSGPLRRTDCSLISDGAAAVVLTNREMAQSMDKAVTFKSRSQVNDLLPVSRRDTLSFEGCAEAWSQSLAAANVTLDDLDLVETHDCFTIAELLEYEAMGLAAPGHGADVVKEGSTNADGKLPVNRSGGLKSKGHPIGATGISMHVMTAMQLCGLAGDLQIPGATLGGVFNMGGLAVANYCSILEPLG
jgi:acetyl-CoA C-acetyltransferase